MGNLYYYTLYIIDYGYQIKNTMKNHTITNFDGKYANVGLLHKVSENICIQLSSCFIKYFDIFTDWWKKAITKTKTRF